MNVEYINPFIEASETVLHQLTGLEVKPGSVQVKTAPYGSDTVAIFVGLTGKIRGQAIFSMGRNVALNLASKMMFGMEVTELDELSKSAISEMTNMILGNTATLLFNRGIVIDITPPSLLMGQNLEISNSKLKTIAIPLNLSDGSLIELDIAAEEI